MAIIWKSKYDFVTFCEYILSLLKTWYAVLYGRTNMLSFVDKKIVTNRRNSNITFSTTSTPKNLFIKYVSYFDNKLFR